MLRRLENATAAMTNMMRQQERTSNNLANANTTGYKRSRIFTEALNERIDPDGNPRSNRILTQAPSLSQGALERTDNPLDVALNGEGFFAVNDPATGATRYTRNGHLSRGADGTLQTVNGRPIQGQAGPIQVPPDAGPIEIAQDGTIRAGEQQLGKLRVVRFENPEQLQRLDDTAFAPNGQAPEPVETPRVKQGFLEGSNVDPMTEMTDMIEHFRLFETQQRMIRSTDQVLGRTTQSLGKF